MKRLVGCGKVEMSQREPKSSGNNVGMGVEFERVITGVLHEIRKFGDTIFMEEEVVRSVNLQCRGKLERKAVHETPE